MKKILIALTGMLLVLGISFTSSPAITTQAKTAPKMAVAVEGTDNNLNEIVMAMYVDEDNNFYAYVTDFKDVTYGTCTDTLVNHGGIQADLISVNGFNFYYYETQGLKIVELEDGTMYSCINVSAKRVNEVRSIMG